MKFQKKHRNPGYYSRGGRNMFATAEAVGVVRLFAPAVLLPVQVVYPPTDGWLWRLCLAILEDALKCLEVCAVRRERVARAHDRHEAWAWVLSDAEYCLSFT